MQKKVKKMRKWMASFLIVALMAGNTGLSAVSVGADDIVTDAAVDPGTDAGEITATEETEPGGVQDLVGSAEGVAEQPANVEQPAEQVDNPEVTGEAVTNTEEVVEEAPTTGTQEESAPAQEASTVFDGQVAAVEAGNSVSQADAQVSAPAPAANQVESAKSEAPKAEAPKAEEQKTEAAAAVENETVKTEEPASQAESAEEAPEQKLNFPAAEQNFTASAAGYDISVKVPANSFEENVTLKASAQTWEQLTGDVRGQLEKEGVDKEHS